VARLKADFDVEIVVRHFPLHPDTPAEGLSLEQLFAGRNIDIPAAQSRIANLVKKQPSRKIIRKGCG
jgi:hypothetical protein